MKSAHLYVIFGGVLIDGITDMSCTVYKIVYICKWMTPDRS